MKAYITDKTGERCEVEYQVTESGGFKLICTNSGEQLAGGSVFQDQHGPIVSINGADPYFIDNNEEADGDTCFSRIEREIEKALAA